MIDFEGLPRPDDAPEPGTCIRIEEPEEGLVVWHLEPPHRPKLAVLDVPLLRDLDRSISDLASRSGGVRGLVITGREPTSFAGGADVDGIGSVTDRDVAGRFVRAGQEVFQRLYRLGRKGGGRILTVAAVGGPVPGGACELSLACDRIVLASDAKTRIGLPEVKLGIFPGWGGTQRLPRRVGVPMALDLVLGGKLIPARKAKRLGVVDRVTPPEYLVRVACDVALGRLACPRKDRGGLAWWLVDKNPLAGALIASKARKSVLERTKGHYPAPLAALPLVVRAPRMSLEEGLAAEAEAVVPLVLGKTAKSLVRLFQLSEKAKKLALLPDGTRAQRVERAAVIGAGVMGGGIASLLALKRVRTRLRDLALEQLDAALLEHQTDVAKRRERRRLQPNEADAAIDRLSVTTEPLGFGGAQIAVEAVAERLEVKRAVFAELASLLPEDAILATNTSSLSVSAIAEGVPHPERVVGMHFFNPVKKMPLVEIVRGERTSDATIARTARLAIDLGKTPVVVKDVAGFLVNRVLGPYLDEALRLLAAGADPQAMDAALVAFGMPMGPCELLDEVGLDIASHAGASLQEAYGERMQASDYLKPLLERGDLGKKSGAGIYKWTRGARGRQTREGRNPRAPRGAQGFALSERMVLDRLLLAMVNEAARCVEEEVAAGPDELDLATVFGTGFAPFRGGVLKHADELGAAEIVERLRRIREATAGEAARKGRFEPAPLLVELARDGRRFHA